MLNQIGCIIVLIFIAEAYVIRHVIKNWLLKKLNGGTCQKVNLILASYVARYVFKKKLLSKLYGEPYQRDEVVNMITLIFLLDVSLVFLIILTVLVLTRILF